MNLKLKAKCMNCDFEQTLKKKGYAYFTKGLYNLNLIGVRSNNKNKITNQYDDILVVIFNDGVRWHKDLYTLTTEPGRYYMNAPCNPKGSAILVPGQYRGCWQIGMHRGKYEALCQRKAVKVYRDNDKDAEYDMKPETIDTGIFGINIHRSNEAWTRNTVDQYSAGCQVLNSPDSFKELMKVCHKQKDLYGNTFTYTLIDEDDLV